MKNKPFKYFLIILFCTIIGCSTRSSYISKEIEKLNRNLPQIVNDVLRIDSLILNRSTNTLSYYYTLMDDSCKDIVINDYDATQKSMAIEIKKSPQMALFKEQKMSFEYYYISNKEKSIVAKVVIKEEMYR